MYNETRCSSPCLLIPLNPPSDFSAMDNSSVASTNNSGDRGHPWCVQQKRGKGSERCVFVHTDAWGEEYNNLIQEIKQVLNPNHCKEEKREGHSTLLKAFSVSSDMTTCGSVGEDGV